MAFFAAHFLSACAASSQTLRADALPAPAPDVPPPEVRGVDLSKWQKTVDFPSVRAAGYSYVFIKVSQGNQETDPFYHTNVRAARCAGITTGSYHFFVSDETAASQFARFKASANVQPGDLPPVVDIEVLHQNDDAQLAAELTSFLTMLEQHYTAKPIIYSGRSFANQHLQGFANYPLWLADYTNADAPILPAHWTRWTFWQHSQDGRVNGIGGAVDLNRFNGTAVELKSLLITPVPAAPACPPG